MTEHIDRCHIVIMAAAVSDFRPLRITYHRIKKEDADQTLELGRTEDILLELGKSGGKRLLVGFAAETDDVEKNAMKKLKDKHLDMILVNDVLINGSGFDFDTNAVTIIDRTGKRTELPTLPKTQVAAAVMTAISDFIKKQNS